MSAAELTRKAPDHDGLFTLCSGWQGALAARSWTLPRCAACDRRVLLRAILFRVYPCSRRLATAEGRLRRDQGRI